MENVLGELKKGSNSSSGSVTPFQALTTALASCVGTGNVSGVVGAISLGGPGAVLWMELVACVGLITQFSEITLSIKHRERNSKGDWVGGPMYYIRNGLGKNWKWLAFLFALFGMLACPDTGDLIQISSINQCVTAAFNAVNPATVEHNFMISLITGIIIAILLAIIYFCGIKCIGRVTEKLVPFMGAIYILGAIIVILFNIENVIPTIKSIVIGAFAPEAVLGGTVGFTIKDAIRRGISRGVNSNEAGMGSAPLGHAAAETSHPVQQGMYGIVGVFMDTIVVCTMTACLVLMSGTEINYGTDIGVRLTINAFSTVFGQVPASYIMAFIMAIFAFSTILGCGLYGARCTEYIFGSKAIAPYLVLFCLIVIIGSVIELTVAWDITDTLNALMIFPNIIGILALSPVVVKLVKEYFETEN